MNQLCNEFEQNILSRSIEARKKQNYPVELTKIPNYRHLLMTNKFSNYSRCTCDHSSHNSDKKNVTNSGCGKHQKKSVLSSDISSDSSSSSCSSSSDSESSELSLNLDSTRSSTSSSESISDRKSSKTNKKNTGNNSEEFEDIKSMEMNRKHNHPERLHKDLCFNEPDQVK